MIPGYIYAAAHLKQYVLLNRGRPREKESSATVTIGLLRKADIKKNSHLRHSTLKRMHLGDVSSGDAHIVDGNLRDYGTLMQGLSHDGSI